MTLGRRTAPWIVAAAAVIAAATAGVFAQDRMTSNAGSLAELTAEVRLLRQSVEQLMRSQTETQALSVYLSAQQSRMVQLGAQLDAARRELEAMTRQTAAIATGLAGADDQLRSITDPQRHDALEQAQRQMRAEQAALIPREQQLRARELELSQAMQLEESRWNDLIQRLQQIVAK